MYRNIALIAAFLFYTALALTGGTAGAAGLRFFEGLPDVPLMEGLRESPAEAYMFDKPEGRIAGAAAYGKSVSPQAALDYYRQTLPQFGWELRKSKGPVLLFRREDETLQLETGEEPEGASLHITISP